jgi:hypothetical protein
MFSKSPRLANSSVKKSQSVEGGREKQKKGKKRTRQKTREQEEEKKGNQALFFTSHIVSTTPFKR